MSHALLTKTNHHRQPSGAHVPQGLKRSSSPLSREIQYRIDVLYSLSPSDPLFARTIFDVIDTTMPPNSVPSTIMEWLSVLEGRDLDMNKIGQIETALRFALGNKFIQMANECHQSILNPALFPPMQVGSQLQLMPFTDPALSNLPLGLNPIPEPYSSPAPGVVQLGNLEIVMGPDGFSENWKTRYADRTSQTSDVADVQPLADRTNRSVRRSAAILIRSPGTLKEVVQLHGLDSKANANLAHASDMVEGGSQPLKSKTRSITVDGRHEKEAAIDGQSIKKSAHSLADSTIWIAPAASFPIVEAKQNVEEATTTDGRIAQFAISAPDSVDRVRASAWEKSGGNLDNQKFLEMMESNRIADIMKNRFGGPQGKEKIEGIKQPGSVFQGIVDDLLGGSLGKENIVPFQKQPPTTYKQSADVGNTKDLLPNWRVEQQEVVNQNDEHVVDRVYALSHVLPWGDTLVIVALSKVFNPGTYTLHRRLRYNESGKWTTISDFDAYTTHVVNHHGPPVAIGEELTLVHGRGGTDDKGWNAKIQLVDAKAYFGCGKRHGVTTCGEWKEVENVSQSDSGRQPSPARSTQVGFERSLLD